MTVSINAADPGQAINLPVAGSMFGGYRVLSLIGSGGMGRVFLAEESLLQVALKLINAARLTEKATAISS